MKTLKSILRILAVTFILLVAAWLYMERIPPAQMTASAIIGCKLRIQEYAMEHNKLPSSLKETKKIKGHHSSIKDAWGHPIIYTVGKDGIVILTSLGKDNKPGGTGDNADIVGVYPSRQPNGRWSDALDEWIINPGEKFGHHYAGNSGDLINATWDGDVSTVKALLAKGADVNAKVFDSGLTALMVASGQGHIEIVQALLAKGADVNAKTKSGDTALDLANASGHEKIAQLLIKAGAKE